MFWVRLLVTSNWKDWQLPGVKARTLCLEPPVLCHWTGKMDSHQPSMCTYRVHIEDWWLSGCCGTSRALRAQARGVLGSTPGDCWPFHFPLFSPHNIWIYFQREICPVLNYLHVCAILNKVVPIQLYFHSFSSAMHSLILGVLLWRWWLWQLENWTMMRFSTNRRVRKKLPFCQSPSLSGLSSWYWYQSC